MKDHLHFSHFFTLLTSLWMSACYTEALPDPECFNQESISIPQEVIDTFHPAEIYQYISSQADHCVNANNKSEGKELCIRYYLNKLGFDHPEDFPARELILFTPINDEYGRCELRCESTRCECLFDLDCESTVTSEPPSCQWLSASSDLENRCDGEQGCTRCK